MSKLYIVLLGIFPLIAICGVNIDDVVAAKDINKEWCEKSKHAFDKIGLESWYNEKSSKREDQEIFDFAHLLKFKYCKKEECDRELYLFASTEIFCSNPYIETDKQMDGWRGSNKAKFLYLTIVPPSKSGGKPFTYKEEAWANSLNLTKEEQDNFYYVTNGKKVGDPKLVVYQIPEILRVKKAVEFYLNNGFSDKFYGDAELNKPFDKNLEFEFPSMIGKSKEEAKDIRFKLLTKFKMTLVKQIANDFILNPKLRKFALANIPLPITPKEGDTMLEKIIELEGTLFPNRFEDAPVAEDRVFLEDNIGPNGGYTFEKYYTPTKSKTERKYSTNDLTGNSIEERLKMFGNFIVANTTVEFDRLSENKIAFKVKIDLPNVAKTYGKKSLSDFLVK
jgi:hypothetical protein